MKITLRDDASAGVGKNGKPALGGAPRSLIRTANDHYLNPRPIRSHMGGNDKSSENPAYPQIRGVWLNGSKGAPYLSVLSLQVPIANLPLVPTTGLVTSTSVGSQTAPLTVAQSSNVKENINELPDIWYPGKVSNERYQISKRDYTGVPHTARPFVIQSGNTVGPTYGPQIRAVTVFEEQISPGGPIPLFPGLEYLPVDEYSTGHEITGEKLLTNRDLKAMRDYFHRLWRDKRIHFGWNACDNSVAPWVSIGAEPRYIHNTQYGSGGLAPYVEGPGIDVPLRYTAQGRRTKVRIYVRIFACMAGGGTGSLSVYNRDDSNGMSGPTALVNTPAVTGSTFQWYPNTTAFNESTDPYFLGNANPLYACDNILLCPSGAGSNIRVAAYTMTVRPSTM